ncbi:MAG: hypothetical protein Q4F13_02550 [Pseudomonadota bacterium]|nr:hypothetical protein [Pseudomonadota bacterium]
MKIAKPDKNDFDKAFLALAWISAIERGEMPLEIAEDEDEMLDFDNADQCRRIVDGMEDLLDSVSLSRVIWGMYSLCDPENRIIDPNADTLELHPSIVQALKDKQ